MLMNLKQGKTRINWNNKLTVTSIPSSIQRGYFPHPQPILSLTNPLLYNDENKSYGQIAGRLFYGFYGSIIFLWLTETPCIKILVHSVTLGIKSLLSIFSLAISVLEYYTANKVMSCFSA